MLSAHDYRGAVPTLAGVTGTSNGLFSTLQTQRNTMSAAQRCVDISELAEAIAQLCAPEIADPFNRGFGFTVPRRRLADVVALARTCRSMFYTCIPIIWHRLTTLDVLLECLPAHLWESVPVKAERGRSRPPQLVSSI